MGYMKFPPLLQTELDDTKFCYQLIILNFNNICDIIGYFYSKTQEIRHFVLLALKEKAI